MTPLRIVHIGKFFPPDKGGMERFVHDLSVEQAQRGHEVLVLAHTASSRVGREYPAPRLEVRRSRVWRLAGGYAPLSPGIFAQMLRASRLPRPSLLHIHCPNAAALGALLLPKDVPVLLHWHADVTFPPRHAPPASLLRLWSTIENRLLRRADGIIATSTAYLESSRILAPHRAKCRVLPLGLPSQGPVPDPEHPAARFLSLRYPGVLNLLAVGRLCHYKGFSVLLEALALYPRARLCLVGDGKEGRKLRELAQRHNIEARLHLAGEISDAALRACFQACDALCLPSLNRSEAFGLVLLEAMREGKPCVASDIPGSGIGSVLSSEKTALLVKLNTASALIQAFERLQDPGLRQHLGANGKKRFERRYQLPNIAAKMELLYQEILPCSQKK